MTVLEADGVESDADEAPSDPAPRRVPDIGWVCGALAALIGFARVLAPLSDNSFFTHLATGRLILDEGRVPTADPYSFTAQGDPWTVQSWLASVIYAGVEDVAGLGAIRFVNALLAAAIGVGVWHLTARSRSLAVRGGVTFATLIVLGAVVSGRPLLFGLLGFVLTFLALDGRLDPRWLVPVGWVWVNTHGSFPYAIGLILVLAVGTRLDRGAWGREVRVLGWSAAGIALGAVNPLGPKLLVFPLTVLEKSEAFRAIVEWKAPTYDLWHTYAVLALVLVAVLALSRRPSWRDGLLLVVFVALGLTSQRNQAVLILVLAPLLAGTLPEIGPAVRDVARPILGAPARLAVLAAAAVFTVVALGSPETDVSPYPVAMIERMEDDGMWGSDSRVVAPDFVGNLREARDGAEARVFIDDRVDMFPVEITEDYIHLLGGRPGWDEILERHEATAVLWEEDTPLAALLAESDRWEIVHREDDWLLAVPK